MMVTFLIYVKPYRIDFIYSTEILKKYPPTGPFFGGFAASKIGRKWGLLSCAIPLLVGWILAALASSVALIYTARVFWGLAVGMLFTISPMYCAEIATVSTFMNLL